MALGFISIERISYSGLKATREEAERKKEWEARSTTKKRRVQVKAPITFRCSALQLEFRLLCF